MAKAEWEKEIDKIRELAKTCNKSEIAEKLRCSEGTVRRLCEKYDIQTIAYSRQKKQRSVFLNEEFTEYAKEHTANEIAEHFEFSLTSVLTAIHRYGIPHKRVYKRWASKDVRELKIKIIKTFVPEYGITNVAEVLGVSVYSVQNILGKKVEK